MATETESKVQVRIVRCPRCLVKLPELPGISLYKCGGCGTVIQAKSRTSKTRQIVLESDSAEGSVLQANEALSSKSGLANVPEVESSMDKYNIGCQDEHETELREDISVSEGPSSSPEFIYPGMDVDGPLKQKNKSQLLQDNRADRREGGESDGVLQECDDLADQVKHLSENENEAGILPMDVNVRLDASLENCGLEASSENCGLEASSVKERAVVDNISEGLSLLRNLNLENIMNDGSISEGLPPDPDSPLNESHVSLYLTSPDQENLDHSPRDGAPNFGRVGSASTFGSSPATEFHSASYSRHPSSMSNYQTAGSYYAYDGSESSYDGTDDHISEHISHPSRKSRDGYELNNLTCHRPVINDLQASTLHHAMKSWSSEIYTENKHKGVSRFPFSSGDPLARDRTGKPFSYQHGLLPPRPGLCSSDKSSFFESEKLDLLRTVWELKDQLNRMHFSKSQTNGRFPSGIVNENFVPFQYDHLVPEREIHPNRHTVSRHAFSEESVRYGDQVNCSCLHCCPRDLQCSVQLPSQLLHCKNGHLTAHSDHSCGNFTTSSTSSQPCASNKLWSGGSETKPDKQEKMRRLNLNRKHLLPIAGGAPFIACYYCLELLQLPAEFLLFQKKCHKLKCNACKKTLRFSLLEGTHLVRYKPSISVPPPSEADDYNSISCQRVELESTSESYRTCSKEGISLASHSRGKITSLGAYSEPNDDRRAKLILNEPRNKKESVKSVVPTPEKPNGRKPTSEIEELPASPSKSPLHHLMGYSSLSQVLHKNVKTKDGH